ncbi:fascin-like isoform X3 [Chrysemys picta bellii]|uniref:fascin-like isoform X3 n=1 Tax=Chrysemys picta bellii TaxID=8478 RepID=UPI0032B1FD4B
MADSTVPTSLPCGLINAANRYLSAEPFRFQVVATGLVLRLRQVWMLRFVPSQGAGAAGQAEESGQRLHLLSWLQRFLAADPNGKVTCDQESPGPGALFLLRQYPDGKVSLQCELSQRYLGGAEDNVTCFAQTVSEGEKWSLHLAQHPNGHMLNPGKQRYMRCDQQTGHMRCDRDLPWGPEAVITLHFDLKEKKYGLRSGAGSLLAADGSLQAELSPQTLYSLELRGGLLALRDTDGRYLTGREGIVKTFKTDKPGRDELFALEPSAAQVSLRTFAGGRFVCCRPGADIYANATSVGNTEIFQLLLNDVTKQACFRSSSGTYLAVGPKDSVVSTSTQDKGVWFSLQYREQRVTLRMADGRHMATRPNGQLLLVPEAAGRGGTKPIPLIGEGGRQCDRGPSPQCPTLPIQPRGGADKSLPCSGCCGAHVTSLPRSLALTAPLGCSQGPPWPWNEALGQGPGLPCKESVRFQGLLFSSDGDFGHTAALASYSHPYSPHPRGSGPWPAPYTEGMVLSSSPS